nr:phosphoribosylanthranilate isomerase [Cuniculiplasma divulgatum]
MCGVTNIEDAKIASDSGATIIGVVLSDLSPRKGSMELVKELKEYGMNVASVYTDLEASLKYDSGEDYAQLHFPNSAQDMEKVREDGRKIISVIDVDREVIESDTMRERSHNADLVLLESRSGIVDKMSDIESFLNKKVGVAGKINIENLRKIMDYHPGFIDASSGLEAYPGKKDASKIRNFFREAGYGK